MKRIQSRVCLGMMGLLVAASGLRAQPIAPEIQRNSPKVLQAFRPVVEQPSHSTVRVLGGDGKEVALGTIVGSEGYIITKASELHGKPMCKLADGRELPATVLGVQDAYDLALLKIDVKNLTPISWRSSKEAHVGQWVASVGPGAEPIAVGVVSVGTRKLKPGDQPPRATGSKSGYLGVALEESQGGAKIMQLVPGGPAQKFGLQVNDVVTEAAGKKVLDHESLINIVQSHRPGEEILLQVKRQDQNVEVKVVLGRMPAAMRGNPQERMGNVMSNRRGGFPTILQHDTVLKPDECGGPLVDLDGRALGINIARAGRTETYAVPSEDVRDLLDDLKSGKLAPKEAPAEAKGPNPKKLDPNVILFEEGRLTTQDPLARFRPGRHNRSFTVKLAEGEEVVVDLESPDFDAYLRIEDAKGKKLAEDDDGAGGGDLNARITFRAPRDETYRVIVTTCDPGETGSFELSVRKTGKAAEKK